MTTGKPEVRKPAISSGWAVVAVTLVIQGAAFLYTYGQLSQKVEDIGSRVQTIEQKVDRLSERPER